MNTDIAERMHMSLPAVSQMIDRLFLLGLLMRSEALDDRRRKDVAVTPKGHALIERIRRARSAEYEAGVASLSHKLRSDLAQLLRKALAALPEESEAVSAARSQSAHQSENLAPRRAGGR